jgi:hypothetical protein
MLGMRTPSPSFIAVATALALVAAACGGGGGDDGAVSLPTASPTDPATTLDAATTSAPTTTAPTTAPATTDASTTAPTTAAPSTAPVTTAAPVLEYCDGAGPLPAGAVLDSSLTLDVMGDGTADDLVEAYDVDGWSRLRLTTGGSVVSEIINPAIDGRYRPVGVAAVFPGDSAELFAVVGDGDAATEVGVFGIDAAECLFAYTYTGTSDEFTMLIRPASPFRSGAFCFDGGIGLFSAEQRDDGFWDASSAAYEIATPGTVQYLGASDDFSEGLEESELTPFEFDCFDLSL